MTRIQTHFFINRSTLFVTLVSSVEWGDTILFIFYFYWNFFKALIEIHCSCLFWFSVVWGNISFMRIVKKFFRKTKDLGRRQPPKSQGHWKMCTLSPSSRETVVLRENSINIEEQKKVVEVLVYMRRISMRTWITVKLFNLLLNVRKTGLWTIERFTEV